MEAIIVVAIIGIIAGICGVFFTSAFNSYFSTVRRAEMVDMADIAIQRLAREVRLAVPNSLRVSNTANYTYLEFVPTKSGGRYRNNGDGSSSGQFLCSETSAGTTNPTFDVLGPSLLNYVPPIAALDYIVIDNDANLPSGTDVYGLGSRVQIQTVGTNSITTGTPFPNANIICSYQNNRFQVVDQTVKAVTYQCPTQNASAQPIMRYQGYGFNTSQPTATSSFSTGTSVTVAGSTKYAAYCTISYNQNVQQRNGLLYVSVTITDTGGSGETITVFRQIHVDNVP